MIATHKDSGGPLAKITLSIEGRPTQFICDTGAARSVIRTKELPDISFLSDNDITCVGVDGTPRKSPLTRPLQVGNIPDLLTRFVVSDTCPLNLLGADVLSRLQASISFQPDGGIRVTSPLTDEDTSALCSIPLLLSLNVEDKTGIPEEVLTRIPSCLWSTGPEDISHLKVPPVMVRMKPGAPFPRKPQYPLKPSVSAAITRQIEALLQNGALIPCTSPCNTPLFPVKKKTPKGEPVKYRMVQDLRAVNEATILETPIVPNPHTLLAGIPPTAKYFTVVDLANAYFSVPLDPRCQFLFSFIHERKSYTWTVMPQGAQNSPSQFSKAMKFILDTWIKLHPDVVLLEYVDDLLLCADTQNEAATHSEDLLCYLAEQGCKASKQKIQWCKQTVVFLGHCISQGVRHLTQERIAVIKAIPVPVGHKSLHAFLGLISYCRSWIPEASLLMQPLYDALKTDPFTLPPEALTNFEILKQILSSAPALGIPDYEKSFKLFVSEREGHATGVLAQSCDNRLRPIGYYSCRLDPVARGAPSCLRAVFAAQALLDKTADLVLGHFLILLAPHDISAVLNQVQPKHMSAARHLRLQCTLLLPDNISLLRCNTLNPSTLLPLFEGGNDPYDISHDCLEIMKMETTHLPTVSRVPLDDPDLTIYVDGSRYADHEGRYHTGYAVTTRDTILHASALPPSKSAQEAELQALIMACKLAEGKRANIYTDSRYALGVACDYGVLWKNRGFLTAVGTPIKHSAAVRDLIDALLLPTQVAVLKVKAHGRLNTQEAQGNHLADTAAKHAAKGVREVVRRVDVQNIPTQETVQATMILQNPPVDWARLKEMQEAASEEEKGTWTKKGAILKDGLMEVNKRPCLPRSMFPAVVQWAHGASHLSKTLMNALINKYYLAPGITPLTNNFCKSCVICAKCNPGRTEKTPMKHLAKAQYPFQRIQIDHIQMPKSGRYEYALVIVDMFSSWPEAFPVTNMTAKTTAKKLLTEIVCRYGVPEVIESDQGPAFTASLTKEIWTALGVTLAFHTPYHPQSSGKVERLNGTIKSRMLKMSQETGMSWPDSLPIALFSVRYTPKESHGLSPYEILFGSAPRLGCYYPQQLDPELDTGTHKLVPGDWVLVKKFVRKHPLEPRYDGPFQVLLITATSVKVAGKNTWIHASHCKKVTIPKETDKDKS
ncbi:uncharacterized protein LOC120935764 [Rana temporaria]|uniref:uncharacterized protein LOC120935764 n=1 Tax=Rana temporaria TaxID=8407 RepID=UPI001AAD8E23|nr:uncharacterized protein LOC120935764 [Rana temporaria]